MESKFFIPDDVVSSVVDPNPKESLSFGRIRIRKKKFGFRCGYEFGFTVVKKKIYTKLLIKPLKENKTYFFILENLSVVQVPGHIRNH
jgi:hypothetical protein